MRGVFMLWRAIYVFRLCRLYHHSTVTTNHAVGQIERAIGTLCGQLGLEVVVATVAVVVGLHPGLFTWQVALPVALGRRQCSRHDEVHQFDKVLEVRG